jgi:quinohemoprotein ethanol dehydrogenase
MRQALLALRAWFGWVSHALAAPEPTAWVTPERLQSTGQHPQDWLSYGRGYDESRHSPLNQINRENVHTLGLAWSVDLDSHRGQESTPLVVDGVMYLTTAWSKVLALDAATGRTLWRYDPKVPGQAAVRACCDVVSRGAAAWRGALQSGGMVSFAAALNRQQIDSIRAYVIARANQDYSHREVQDP